MARYTIERRVEIPNSKHVLLLMRTSGNRFCIEIQSNDDADRNERGLCFGACSRRFDLATAEAYFGKCLAAFSEGRYSWKERKGIVDALGGVEDTFANVRVFDTPQKLKIRDELLKLERAWRNILSREGYNKACIALECAEFPYELVQYDRDGTGKPLRNYKYGWKSKGKFGDDTCALYIEETDAGRKPVGGIRAAFDLIEKVLLSNI